MTAHEALKQMPPSQWPPVYVLTGTDEFWARRWLMAVRRHFLGAGADSGYHLVEGAATFSEVALRLAEPGFFAQRTMVVARNPKWPAKEDRVSQYCRHPAPDALLVIWDERGLGAWTKTVSAAQVIEVSALDRPRFVAWIREEAQLRQIQWGRGGLEAFVACVFPQAEHAVNELDKMSVWPQTVWDATAVTNQVVPWQREEPLWELTDAVANGRRDRALALLMRELQQGKPAVMLFVMMARRVAEVQQAVMYQRGARGQKEFESACGLKPYVAKKIWSAARHWDVKTVERLTAWAVQIDRALKTGYGEATLWLVAWTVNMVPSNPPAGKASGGQSTTPP
jgi:DNA polymerase-3 subunit delta